MGVNNNNNNSNYKHWHLLCVTSYSKYLAYIHLILTTILRKDYYYYPHSTAKETEFLAQALNERGGYSVLYFLFKQ